MCIEQVEWSAVRLSLRAPDHQLRRYQRAPGAQFQSHAPAGFNS